MSTDPCAAVKELQESLAYSALIFAKFLICTAGAVLVGIHWRIRGTTWLVHSNSRTLFAFFLALLCIMSSVYAVMYGFEFTRLRLPCFVYDFRFVLFLRSAGIATIVAAHLLLVSISLERLYGSLYPLHFEQHTSRFVAITVSLIIIVLAFFTIFYPFSDRFSLFWKKKMVATIDAKTKENTFWYLNSFYGMSGLFFCTSWIFPLDLFINSYLNARKARTAPLAVAYQYSENRRVIQKLWPIEVTSAAMTIAATVVQTIYSAVRPNASSLERALVVEASALSPLFPFVFVIIREWQIRRSIPRTIKDVQSEQNNVDHFEEMRAAWN